MSKDTDVENKLYSYQSEKGKDKLVYWEWYGHTTVCKIDSQWEFAVWLRKLKQGLCINLEGVSKGRGYMYTYRWFMLKFDRKQQNSVKQIILQ